MSFLTHLNRSVQPYIGTNISAHLFKILRGASPLRKSTSVDAIDCFTNDLVERKSLKWELLREKKQPLTHTSLTHIPNKLGRIFDEMQELKDGELSIDVQNLNQTQIDNLLMDSMSSGSWNHFFLVVDQCIKYGKVSSDEVTLQVLDFLAQIKKKALLEQYIDMCMNEASQLYTRYGKFDCILAKCMWNQGNCDAAFALLNQFLPSVHADVQVHFQNTLKMIVSETVGVKSEAVLISLKKLAEHLFTVNRDVFLLALVWKNCFNSDWFSDQQHASALFGEYEAIRRVVGKKAAYLCYSYLRNHQVENVQRLIELFLRHSLNDECRICLGLLFDYQYWRKDLRSCSEIIRTSIDINLPLSDAHNHKLINLLVGDFGPPVNVKTKQIKVPTFELKF